MLIFPALTDRVIVLATALVMTGGLGYIVNMMRVRAEEKKQEKAQ
jgi:hypothetical protein